MTIKILEDNVITNLEKYELLEKLRYYLTTDSYSDTTLSFQILIRILKGISCVNIIRYEELTELQNWLFDNMHLKGNYPYDEIMTIIEDVLLDGIITSEENSKLYKLFNKFMDPTDTVNDGLINIKGKLICLTGDFKFWLKR